MSVESTAQKGEILFEMAVYCLNFISNLDNTLQILGKDTLQNTITR